MQDKQLPIAVDRTLRGDAADRILSGKPTRRRRIGVRGDDDEGYILVVVLAVLGLMGLVALLLSRSVSLDIKVASFAARRAEAESVADGVARLVVRHLVVNAPVEGRSGQLRLDGTPISCRIGANMATLTLVDTDGLVNLNLAAPELIERLIAGIVSSKTDAAELARAVVDFRTSGDTSIGGGSKRAIYELAGLAHGPKMAPFESVIELDQVVGMTPEVRERLKPLVTVRSRSATVNVKVASAAVLAALAGDGKPAPTDTASVELLRSSINLPATFTFVPRTRGTQTTTSKTIVVTAAVLHANGGRFARYAAVDLGASGQAGATLQEWREAWGEAVAMPTGASDGLPACVGTILSLEQP